MRKVVGAVAVILVLLLAGAGAEIWARQRTEAAIAERVAAADSEVTVHGFPVLLQLARGELEEVTITAPTAEFDGVRLADLNVRLLGTSTTSPSTVREMTTTALLPTEEILRQLGPVAGQVAVSTEGGLLRVRTDLVGFEVDLGFEVSVVEGGVSFDPVDLVLGGEATPIDELPFGLGTWVRPVVVPVAPQEGMVLTAVEIEPEGVRVTLSGSDIVVDEELMGQP